MRPGYLNKTLQEINRREINPQSNLKLYNLGFKVPFALCLRVLFPHVAAHIQGLMSRPLPFSKFSLKKKKHSCGNRNSSSNLSAGSLPSPSFRPKLLSLLQGLAVRTFTPFKGGSTPWAPEWSKIMNVKHWKPCGTEQGLTTLISSNSETRTGSQEQRPLARKPTMADLVRMYLLSWKGKWNHSVAGPWPTQPCKRSRRNDDFPLPHPKCPSLVSIKNSKLLTFSLLPASFEVQVLLQF